MPRLIVQRRGSRLFHQRRISLRHAIHLHDCLIDLLDAGALLCSCDEALISPIIWATREIDAETLCIASPAASRFDGRVERENVGLKRNAVDDRNNLSDAVRTLRDAVHFLDDALHDLRALRCRLQRVFGKRVGRARMFGVIAARWPSILPLDELALRNVLEVPAGPLERRHHTAFERDVHECCLRRVRKARERLLAERQLLARMIDDLLRLGRTISLNIGNTWRKTVGR